ncbi:hypothetical protein P0D69_38440 [Paraburkholderia sediminicola]|uniref:hypothetical protein n=1 Tax=Paraburkholderia sediminicola TaxID=458836 RepID=UPI0038BA77E1
MTQKLKFSAAQAFNSILARLGYDIYLGGGGGATVWGGPRPVKDLDFKMGLRLKERWKDDSRRGRIIAKIVSGLNELGYRIVRDNLHAKKQLPYVLRLTVVDRLSDFRVKRPTAKLSEQTIAEVGIEISLTAAGLYRETVRWEANVGPALFLQPLDATQLALDKVFVFAQRSLSTPDKIRTDFEDLAALLMRFHGPIETELGAIARETELLVVREKGYKSAAQREKAWSQQVTNEARKRVVSIRAELDKPPAWASSQDPALRKVEVKFMVAKVEGFLALLDRCLGYVV